MKAYSRAPGEAESRMLHPRREQIEDEYIDHDSQVEDAAESFNGNLASALEELMEREPVDQDPTRGFIFQLMQKHKHQVPMGWQTTTLFQLRLVYIHEMYVT